MVDNGALGARVKQCRLSLGLTLKAVESLAGVSATHISEIERGKTSPTIGALQKLARALGRDITHFLEQEPFEDLEVQRATERGTSPFGDTLVRRTSLSARIPGGELAVFRLELEPGSPARQGEGTDSDEIYLVESGCVRFEIGPEVHELGAGDSIHLRARLVFRYVNPAPEPARLFQFCGSRPRIRRGQRA